MFSICELVFYFIKLLVFICLSVKMVVLELRTSSLLKLMLLSSNVCTFFCLCNFSVMNLKA